MVPLWLASAIGLPLMTVALFRHRNFIKATVATLPLSVRIIARLIKLKLYFRGVILRGTTAHSLLEKNAQREPHKIFFYFEDQTWTYQQVNHTANKIANYFSSRGLKKGDVVVLLMENCPENVCIWLGLSKIGVIASIINTNLLHESLRATLNVGNPKATIFHGSTEGALKGVISMGGFNQLLFSFGPSSMQGAINLMEEISEMSSIKPKSNVKITSMDELFYMYTSGSTGLPKAVSYTHARFLSVGAAIYYFWDINSKDIFYTCLPLYHAAAGVTGVGCTLTVGASMVLRKKFSASRFWKDCTDYNVTVVQYIGEICRYLLRRGQRPEEGTHKVQKFVGSGLRAEIWEHFVTRFKIPFVGELYGATESSCGLVNFDGTVGAIGYIPRPYYPFYPAGLVKVDDDTGEPIRDPKTGLAIRCGVNEPGEWMGTIIRNHSLNDFPGYKNAESDKKVVQDIFKSGDECFRSNDMMVMDEYGYFRFKDRAALNYRWKGENISSVEVENTVSRLIGLKDVAAYGVKVPGADGNAGMVTIADPDNSVDLSTLLGDMRKQLPSYAIPVFLRVTPSIETTGTYKTLKKVLQAEGFDITKIQDKIYVFIRGAYMALDANLYGKIMTERISL